MKSCRARYFRAARAVRPPFPPKRSNTPPTTGRRFSSVRGVSGRSSHDRQRLRQRGADRKQAIDYFIATKNNAVLDGGLVIFAAGQRRQGHVRLSGRLPRLHFGHRLFARLSAGLLHELRSGLQRRGSGRRRPTSRLREAAPRRCFRRFRPSFTSRITAICRAPRWLARTYRASPRWGFSYALAKGKQYTVAEFKSMLLTSVNDIDTYLRRHQTIPDHHAAAQLPQADGYRSDRRLPASDADRGHTLPESESRRTAAAFARQSTSARLRRT